MLAIALVGEDVPVDVRNDVETLMGGVDDSSGYGPVEKLTKEDLIFDMLNPKHDYESFLAEITVELTDRKDLVQSAREVAESVITADGGECDMTVTSVIISEDWSVRFHAGLRALADAFRDRQRELGLGEVEFLVIQEDGRPEIAFL